MGDRQQFGDENMNVFGNGNRNFSYNNHAPVPVPAPAPGTSAGSARAGDQAGPRTPSEDERRRSVFVVHGRDEEVRGGMFGLLRRLDLRPLEWEDLVRATGQAAPFLGEVVAGAPAQAQAALVLLTPDDVAKLHPQLLGDDERDDETRLTGQPRQNVLIELGMVLMAYPARTVIVEVGRLRHVADTAGRNVVRFDGSADCLAKIVARLKLAGCRLDDTRQEWRETGHFRDLSAYRRIA